MLDTNIVSEIVRRVPNPNVLSRLQRERAADLQISVVTVFELRYGAARSAKPAALWSRIQTDILDRFAVLPFTAEDSLAAGDLMSSATGGGNNLSLQDIWLAGVAFRRGLRFVTRNRRDFDRITGLQVENWFE